MKSKETGKFREIVRSVGQIKTRGNKETNRLNNSANHKADPKFAKDSVNGLIMRHAKDQVQFNNAVNREMK